jgi:hypothetical protein
MPSTHQPIGQALGGEAGARLAAPLGMLAGPDSLLRRAAEPPCPSNPRSAPRNRARHVKCGTANPTGELQTANFAMERIGRIYATTGTVGRIRLHKTAVAGRVAQ